MSSDDHIAFGGQWDLGQSVIEQLLSYPISHKIRQDAERAGIDMSNPRRSIAALLVSSFMSISLGAFLGPFMGMIGGLMGEAVAIASTYPGDRAREEKRREELAFITLEVKAIGTALEVTKEHVSKETWNAIVDEYQNRVDRLGNMKATEREAIQIGKDIIFNSVYSVDKNVYWNFNKVYQTAKKALGF